ncbi:hypothetical protein ABFX02_14G033800 [Erythranthe guttata]
MHFIYKFIISLPLSLSRNMVRTGEGEGAPPPPPPSPPAVPLPECCMCGDCGLSSEIFTCKHCRFRSQHKYCSNLYPEAESYDTCNWCLSQIKDVKKSTGESDTKITYPKSASRRTTSSTYHQNRIKKSNKIDHIKKQNKFSKDRFNGGIITRAKSSEEISNNGGGIIIKQVFRNKVRRYKLLDDVSS